MRSPSGSRPHARPVLIRRIRRKCVLVYSLKHGPGLARCEERNRLSLPKRRKTQRAQIIQPKNVVRMRMCVEHSVHPRNLFPQRLLAKVRTGIDHHHTLKTGTGGRRIVPALPPSQHHRRPQPPVMRISRHANRTPAPQRWNPHRSPGSKECQLPVHEFMVTRQSLSTGAGAAQRLAQRIRGKRPARCDHGSAYRAFTSSPAAAAPVAASLAA